MDQKRTTSTAEGALLVQRAVDAGLSTPELSKALEVSWFTVYRWHKGTHTPQRLYLRELRRLVEGAETAAAGAAAG